MNLYRLKINGTPFNPDSGYSDSELNGNTPYVFADVSPDENIYDDITTVENIWNSNLLDWARRRDETVGPFYAIASANLSTYGNLNSEQKLIGAKYFLVPYSLRVSNGVVTEQEDKDNWLFLLQETKESRINCVESMRLYVGQYIRLGTLTLAQTQDFFKDVFELINWFEQANLPDFKQWLTNEVASPYENSGFAQKAYYSNALRDELMEIYNGKY